MVETTLCYIEKDGKYLMLYRNKKKEDPNQGKWIGVGGKLESSETPDACVMREVWEETGLKLTQFTRRGVITFLSDCWNDERMYLYTASGFEGELADDCNEGHLQWIAFEEIPSLNLWEGDRVFLKELLEGRTDINLTLRYEGEKLVGVEH